MHKKIKTSLYDVVFCAVTLTLYDVMHRVTTNRELNLIYRCITPGYIGSHIIGTEGKNHSTLVVECGMAGVGSKYDVNSQCKVRLFETFKYMEHPWGQYIQCYAYTLRVLIVTRYNIPYYCWCICKFSV